MQVICKEMEFMGKLRLGKFMGRVVTNLIAADDLKLFVGIVGNSAQVESSSLQ